MSHKKDIKIIGSISFVAIMALIWLIYFAPSLGTQNLKWVLYLPFVNAILNTISATFISIGIYFIKTGQKKKHKKLMITAFLSSTLFLISYITYHAFHGDTKFVATGFIRPVYFFILISHIVLSIVALPMILLSMFWALKNKISAHKKIAKWTWIIWLYVSVTGVLIYLFLKIFN